MSVGDLTIDTLSLQEFQTNLQARLDEAVAAIVALSAGRVTAPPLGGFEDATRTIRRYERLRDEYVERLQRLSAAVMAAQAGTTEILDAFDTLEELASASVRDVSDAVQPVSEVLRA